MSTNTLPQVTESEKLSPNTIIPLYVIDATNFGAGILRFCNDSMPDGTDVAWNGDAYARFPIQVTGFDYSSRGQLPRPKISVSNVYGTFTALNKAYQDLTRARFIRRRVFFRNLDGQPGADPNAHYPEDIFFFLRKIQQTKNSVQYELASALEIDGLAIP